MLKPGGHGKRTGGEVLPALSTVSAPFSPFFGQVLIFIQLFFGQVLILLQLF